MVVFDWNLFSEVMMILVVLIWKLAWYAIALFRTIEKKQIRWFTVLFVSLFLLPFDFGLVAIIYLVYPWLFKSSKSAEGKKKRRR